LFYFHTRVEYIDHICCPLPSPFTLPLVPIPGQDLFCLSVLHFLQVYWLSQEVLLWYLTHIYISHFLRLTPSITFFLISSSLSW
jgi:hypothetical protein